MGMSSGGGGRSAQPSLTTFNSTSTVTPPAEVLNMYRDVTGQAANVAATPWQNYSNNVNDFVAPLNSTQQDATSNIISNIFGAQPAVDQSMSGMSGAANNLGSLAQQQVYNPQIAAMSTPYYDTASAYTNNAATAPGGLDTANPYFQSGSNLIGQGGQSTNQVGQSDIQQYMSPYQSDVINSTMGLLGQQNEQAMSGALGNVIKNGGFGGDRAGIMMANQNQQNQLSNANVLSGLENQNYSQAVNTAVGQRAQNQADLQRQIAAGQAQAGIGSQAGQLQQADLSRELAAGQQMAGIGTAERGAYENQQNQLANDYARQIGATQAQGALEGQIGQMGLSNNQNLMSNFNEQMQAGTLAQQTQQAGLDAMYNQWMQQKAYPFLTTQWLSDIYGGLGPLYGSTTSSSGTSMSMPFKKGGRVPKAGGGDLSSLVAAQGQFLHAGPQFGAGQNGGGKGFVPESKGRYGQLASSGAPTPPKAELWFKQPNQSLQNLGHLGEQAKGLFQMGKGSGLGDLGKAFDTGVQTAATEAPAQVADAAKDVAKDVAEGGKKVLDAGTSAGSTLADAAGDMDVLSMFAKRGGRIGRGFGGVMPFADNIGENTVFGSGGPGAIPFAGAGGGQGPFPMQTLGDQHHPQMLQSTPPDMMKMAGQGQQGGGGGGGGEGGKQAQDLMKQGMEQMKGLSKEGQSFANKAGNEVANSAQQSASDGAKSATDSAQSTLGDAGSNASDSLGSAADTMDSAASDASSSLADAAGDAGDGLAGAGADAAEGAADAGIDAAAGAAEAGAGAAADVGADGLLALAPLLLLKKGGRVSKKGRRKFATDGGVDDVEGKTVPVNSPEARNVSDKPVDIGDIKNADAPPGTHYQQFGPNRILMDDKTGATAAQVEGWKGATEKPKEAPKSDLGEAPKKGSSADYLVSRERTKEDAPSRKSDLGGAPAAATKMPNIDVAAETRGDGDPLYSDSMNKYMHSLHRIESGGYKNPYAAVGVPTRTGDRAYGKYQIMGANIPSWGRMAGYKDMTIGQFMSDPQAQEKIARTMFANYMAKGASPTEAAMMWLGGPGYAKHMGAADAHGTTVGKYASLFNKYMGNASGDMPTLASGADFDTSKFTPEQRKFMASAAGGLNPPTEESGGLDGIANLVIPLIGAAGGALSQSGNGGLAMALGGLGGAGAAASGLAADDMARQKFLWDRQRQMEELRLQQEGAQRAQEELRIHQQEAERNAKKWEYEEAQKKRADDAMRKIQGVTDQPVPQAPPQVKPQTPSAPPMQVTPGPTDPEVPVKQPGVPGAPSGEPAVPASGQPITPASNKADEVAGGENSQTQTNGIPWDRVAPNQRIPELYKDINRLQRIATIKQQAGLPFEGEISAIKNRQEQIKEFEERGYVQGDDGSVFELPGKTQIDRKREMQKKQDEAFVQSQIEQGKQTMKEINEAGKATGPALMRIAHMKHEFEKLPSDGLAAPGQYAAERMNIIRGLNDVLQIGGFKPLYQNETALMEGLQKDTFRLGAELSASIGGREPGFIVQAAVGANPGIQNSKQGFKAIIGSLEQVQIYNRDKMDFFQQWHEDHHGNMSGVEKAFRTAHPQDEYTSRVYAATVPEQHKKVLQNASEDEFGKIAKAIDKKYGKGVAAAILEGY
jgi:hypothetical protein